MKTLSVFVLCTILFSGCATTVPTVEEGWVPLAEWNHRVSHTNPLANFAESIQGNRTDSRTVRTYCYSSRRYTRCSSY